MYFKRDAIMTNPVCEELLLYQPTNTEAKDFYSSYIVNCILNAFFTVSAIILNAVTIQALRRTSSLSKPLKTLLLSLAVSDLGVGLLCHPLYLALLVRWILQDTDNENQSCAVYSAVVFVTMLFSSVSFSGVMALTVDRFLAIHLHLRYQELVTHKRVIAVAICLWVSSAFLALFRLLVYTNITYLGTAIIGVVGLALAAVLYCKIYFAVRRHRNQIQVLQVQQVARDGEMANVARVRKSSLGTFYVYLVFLACYFPHSFSYAFVVLSGLTSATKLSTLYTWVLLLFNSSLNPVIYCWKMRHIRHAIMDILRNMFPSHN